MDRRLLLAVALALLAVPPAAALEDVASALDGALATVREPREGTISGARLSVAPTDGSASLALDDATLDATPLGALAPDALVVDAPATLATLPALPLALPDPLPSEGIVPDPFEKHRRSRDRGDDDLIERTSVEAEGGPDVASDEAPSSAPEPLPPAPVGSSSGVATLALGVTALVAALASLYSRLQKHNLLRSAPRAQVHERILATPGATLAELAAATGISRSALVHHCQMLERHGLLASRHDGLNRRFYPPGARDAAAPRPATKGEVRVIALLREEGPLTQAELAAKLGVSKQAVSAQVKRMVRDRRLVPAGAEEERRWAAPDEAGEAPISR